MYHALLARRSILCMIGESVQPGEASVDVGTKEVDNEASPELNVTIKVISMIC